MKRDTVAYEGIIAIDGPQVERISDNGARSELPQCQAIMNHSPDGFAWGYGGSGPAQLALALLFDILGDKEKAIDLHMDFKFRWVGRLPMNKSWKARRADIEAVIAQLEEERRGNN